MTDSSSYPINWRSYLSPRYWPTWLGISLLWLLSRLPYDTQLAIGRQIGSLVWHLLPARRRVTLTNLAIGFPDTSLETRVQMARKVYAHVGMSIAEGASLWFRPTSFYDHRFTLKGADNLEQALSLNRGVILLQAHFSLLEMNAAILGPRYPVSAVFDPPKNALFAAFLTNRRSRFLQSLIDNRQMRQVIRKLKQGEVVWYSPDQSVSRSHGGIETQFFNQAVLTTAGTRRIASMTGAIVLPLVPTRHGNTGRYTLTIGQPLIIGSDDDQQATQQVNDLFEAQVRSQPEQYFWMHKRFKPPGPEHDNPYQR
ncbi:MAG: lysophospholipid acyltransferase family protein [Granulosicoccus sp.]